MSESDQVRGRPTTRSQSNPNLLVPPPSAIHRPGALRSERLRSPSNVEEEETVFQFPAQAPISEPTMADATVRALTDALQGMKVSSRKPELPAFDAKNVDMWLKRIDKAFRRSGITDPQDKFAFIEPKFAVDTDPRINELMFGDNTADDWAEFERYLRDRYGRTKAQQTAVILDGVQRDGKLPSEMFAFIKDQIGSITIDDIMKEMVMRELPTEVRRTIHDKVKTLDGAATVKLADEFFDKNGKPLHKAPNSPVNSIESPTNPGQATEEPEDINAVNRRPPRRDRPFRPQQQQPKPSPFTRAFQSPSQPRYRSSVPPASSTSSNQRRTHSGAPTVKPVKLCRWHSLYGKEAFTCEVGCDRYNDTYAVKARAGRQT